MRFASGRPRRSSSARTAWSPGAQTTAICFVPRACHCSIKWPSTVVPLQGSSSLGCPMRADRPAPRMTAARENARLAGDRVIMQHCRKFEPGSNGVVELCDTQPRLLHQSINPSIHYSIAPLWSVPGLQLHHIMRRRFALAGGTDPDEPGLLPQLGEISRTEIAHAELNPPNELREDEVHRAAHLFQGLDPFRRDFARRVRRVAVARRRPLFHRRQAAHAPILLVELAADFH